jgi:hypothetical protein
MSSQPFRKVVYRGAQLSAENCAGASSWRNHISCITFVGQDSPVARIVDLAENA